jgi:hypothetical protein
LRDSDDGIENQDGQDLGESHQFSGASAFRQGTYHDGINEGAPAAFLLEQSQDKGHSGRAKEDDDELVLELL